MPKRSTVEAFVALVEAGDFIGAIERFYAPNASIRENLGPPREGKAALIENEQRVMAGFKTITARLQGPILIEGDQVAFQWHFGFTSFDGSVRTLQEIAWQVWKEELLLEEQFFYDPGQLRG